MKKIFGSIFIILFVTLIFTSPVFAEKIYEYQNISPLNDRDSVRVKGCNEFVELPATGISAPDDRTVAMLKSAARSMRDPYVVTINDVTYVMVKDRSDNNWSADDILGINDPKENRFSSLIALNSDNNHAKLIKHMINALATKYNQPYHTVLTTACETNQIGRAHV